MSLTNSFEDEVLAHILNGTAISSLSGVTTFYLSLHTADPGEAGNQSTSETSYTGYARKAISREAAAIAVSGGATNVDQIAFGQCTDTNDETLLYGGLGLSATGTGTLLMSGPLPAAIELQNLMTPVIEAGNINWTCD